MFQTLLDRFDPIPVKIPRDSETVPDMSYTPREILSKFSRGEKVPLGFNGLYDSEDESDHLGDHDPSVFEEDPTRDPNFDQGEYVEQMHALRERQSERAHGSNGKKVSTSERLSETRGVEPQSDATSGETTSGEVKPSSSGQKASE